MDDDGEKLCSGIEFGDLLSILDTETEIHKFTVNGSELDETRICVSIGNNDSLSHREKLFKLQHISIQTQNKQVRVLLYGNCFSAVFRVFRIFYFHVVLFVF